MPVPGCRAFPVRSPIRCVVHSSLRVDREPGKRACVVHSEAEEMLLGAAVHLHKSY